MSDIQTLINRTENALTEAVDTLGKLEQEYHAVKARLGILDSIAATFENSPERTPGEVEKFAHDVLAAIGDFND